MQLETSKQDAVLIIKALESRLDAKIANDFISQITKFVEQGDRRIVLDLSAVEFVDSSGLGAIVAGRKMIANEGKFAITGVSEAIMGMFRLTRMDRVFHIFDTQEEAVRFASE